MKLRKVFLLPAALFLLAQFGASQTSGTQSTTTAVAPTNRTISNGTEIKVRTDQAIPAKPARGSSYAATVSNDVMDNQGAVIIPRGARAQLAAVASNDNKDTVLDLRSVTLNGRRYSLTTSTTGQAGTPGGIGANSRTAKYVGGGAAVGALLGAIFGGGKGAAIGALAGGAGGAGAQVYTGRKKDLPAETELTYKLAQDLTLQASPVKARQRGTLSTREQQ
jgi:hypothetical protein